MMDERELLKNGDLQSRQAAAESLSRMGQEAAHAAVELIQACGEEPSVQQWAVAALEDLGEPHRESLPAIATLAGSADSLTAYWAITLLGRCEQSARSHQDQLATILCDSPTISVRERAAWALGRMQADSPSAIAALRNAADNDQPRLSALALAALNQPV